MMGHPLARAMMGRLEALWGHREPLWRGLFVSLGAILLMFSCLTILTLSSCTLAP